MTPCPGSWATYRNHCECPSCRRMERTRNAYITASEHACRLVNQGHDPHGDVVKAAERERDRLGAAWEQLGIANPGYGSVTPGARYVPASAQFSRPGSSDSLEDKGAA